MTETDGTGALAPRMQQGADADGLLVAALGWLLEQGERSLASALLRSECNEVAWDQRGAPTVELIAPPSAATVLRRETRDYAEEDIGPRALDAAFNHALGDPDRFWPRITIRTLELLDSVLFEPVGPAVPREFLRHQGTLYPGPGLHEHNGLRFRSLTETRVAEALDEIGVMYLPLPVAVRRRVKFEPDFVILRKGKLGVLEVDGPQHTALTRAREDRRAAWFYQSGVRLVHHVAVEDIDADAKGAVWRFLRLLDGPTV